MSTVPNFSQVLKEKTSALHEKLDHAPLISEVMSPNLTDEMYEKIIARMHECFRIVEGQAQKLGGEKIFADYFYESRLPALKKDFKEAGSKRIDENCTPALAQVPGSADAAVGMLYVLHGSSMGGQFIARKLKSRIPETELNFYGQSEHFAKSWHPFKEKLDQAGSQLNLDSVGQGADWAFDVFYRVFTHVEQS